MADVRLHAEGLEGWIRGFDGLEHEAAREGQREWDQATDYMFSRTQEVVHILTGFLKASGHSSTTVEGDRIVGTIEYDADYAIYEAGRGGNHDFITIARVASERQFSGALVDTWDRIAGGM